MIENFLPDEFGTADIGIRVRPDTLRFHDHKTLVPPADSQARGCQVQWL